MKNTMVSAVAALAALVAATPTPTDPDQPSKRSLPTVVASGNAFFANGNRFYIRGIDYQPFGSSKQYDPLADTTACKRDIAEFKKLGINTIRVYQTDNSANHDECMNALADANIYVILDANNPLYSINRYQPAESYNTMYLQSVFATIDSFVKYDNTLAFFSGNEVINDVPNSTLSARYVKATTRDMRQYIRDRKYRAVPVGYSAADVAQNRMQLAQYMNCGTEDERSDFFAFNDYSWCNSDFKTAAWDVKVKNFTGYGIPIFLSEYGCIKNRPRDFSEMSALMNSEMTGVYSGGVMYEYSEEPDNYGIVKISDDGSLSEMDEFSMFASALSKYPAPTNAGQYSTATNSVACPTKDPNWLVDSTLLPAMPEGAKAFFSAGAGTGPGLNGNNGAGSQNADGTSTGDAAPGSGSATAAAGGGASPTKNAGFRPAPPMDKAPFILTGLVFVLTLAGTLAL